MNITTTPTPTTTFIENYINTPTATIDSNGNYTAAIPENGMSGMAGGPPDAGNSTSEEFFGLTFVAFGLERYIYITAILFCILFFIISDVLFIKFKNWYIIKQRNFPLTIIGSVFNFLTIFFNIITQLVTCSCVVSYYSATVLTFIMQVCVMARSLRLIFLYRLNIYKVTELSQKKFIQNTKSSKVTEPNVYYKAIYKLVDKRIVYWFILIPVLVEMVISVALNYVFIDACGFKLVAINEKIDSYSNGAKIAILYSIAQINGMIFLFINIIIAIIFTFGNIKDDQRGGIKFDCWSTSVVIIITEIIHAVCQTYNAKINKNPNVQVSEFLKGLIKYSKAGILFYVLIGIYIQFTSVVIPVIKCYQAKKLDKKYQNEPTNTMQYFYKILNSPSLVEELKAIAIQEFVVENVLFWENYCTLQRLVFRYRHKKEFFNDDSSSSHLGIALNSGKSYQDANSQNSGNSHDNDSYDPNFPLMPQLVPYFNAFYHTFIDIEGPASVNISSATIRRIYHDFYTYPTVGIFDEAKDEVVDSMFLTLFPILLQKNRKQLGELYSQN